MVHSGRMVHVTTIVPRSNNKKLLQNVVCLVTGASRGIGKGIALQLGSQGAIVYVTGTTTTPTTSPAVLDATSTKNSTTTQPLVSEELQETIEQTAYEIQQLGGIGIPIRCDHSNDTDVYLVLQQIEHEYGYLDLLVNNAFRFPNVSIPSDEVDDSNNSSSTSTMEFLLRRKFWQQGALAWDTIHTVGLRSHYMTTCMAMKLLFQARPQTRSASSPSVLPRPLIVMISSFGGLTYSFNVAYGVGKAGVDRMVKDMAYELASDDICIVSLWPGVVNTERTQRSVRNGEWDRYVQLSLDLSETPQFTGRAIVALATDPDNIQKSGTVQVVAELATEYGFTDVDGDHVPPSIRSLRFLLYNYAIQTNPMLQNRIPYHWIPDIRIPFWIMALGQPPPSSSSYSSNEEALL
jgi:dehydrogenase/reductase SDR family member 1